MTSRLSDKPYVADVVFKDGSKRELGYAVACMSGGFFQFHTVKDGPGPVIFINADLVASVEFEESLQTTGLA